MVLKLKISKRVENRFREEAMKRYGYQKGALSEAAEEAIWIWIKKSNGKKTKKLKDPVKSMEGLLKDIDIDSVKLQHEAKKIWSLKVIKHVSD